MENKLSAINPLVSNLPTSCCDLVSAHFTSSAAVILAITGAAKVWSAFGDMKVLALLDPITGLAFGHLMLAAGIIEVVAAMFCVFNNSIKLRIFVIAWLVTNFVIYRIGLWAVGWQKPCSCLGTLTEALHISPHAADTALKIILAYLLVGSYATLFWLWRQKRLAA